MSAYGTTGLAARLAPQTGAWAPRIVFSAVRSLAAALLSGGILWGFAITCGLEVNAGLLLALCLLGAAIVAASSLWERGAYAACGLALAAVAAFALAAGPVLAEGARAAWTCFASTLADSCTWRLPELALQNPLNRAGDAAGFVMAAAPFAGALASALCGLKSRLWLFVPVAGAVSLVVLANLALPPVPLAVACIGAALYFGASTAREAQPMPRGSLGAARAASALAAALCVALGTGAIAAIAPPSAWDQPAALASAREAVENAVHDLRYGAPQNALRDGRLSGLSAWQAQDATALVIEGDDMTAQYLRGFVGTTRDAAGWKRLDERAYHESDALFWWLGADGFDAKAQLAGALAAARQDEGAARQLAANKVRADAVADARTVRNVKASSEYLYTPYGLCSDVTGADLLDRACENSMPRGVFGARAYSYESRDALETGYPDIAAAAWVAHDPQSAYWSAESNYNAYAYKTYAVNSEADEMLAEQVLGASGVTASDEHVDYVAAAKRILAWLDANVVYDETAAAPADGSDVLNDFLTGSKRGWSAHYATAAVVMLRHFGLPARYVEGYVVKPADVKAAQKGAVEVPAANGHAWAEFYVDGAGWVPFETVPVMRKTMPQPNWARGIEADSTQHAQVPPQPQPLEQPEQTSELPQALVNALIGLGIALVALLAAFDVFAVVFFIVSLVRRLAARSRRRRAFADADDTRAVCSMASWMADVARYRFPQIPAGDARGLAAAVAGAYGEKLAESWADAQRIARKAAFSTHGATADERARVADASGAFAAGVAKRESMHERWVMKYLERLM